jgi:hypothetical protein
MKPTELQLTYKKVISFTEQQKKSLKKLEEYDVNVNEFIRIAVREKLSREWRGIKESKDNKCPF